MVMYGAHLKALPVHGVFKAYILSPTQSDCDADEPGCDLRFRKATSLPYCVQSSEPYAGKKRTCEHGSPRHISVKDGEHMDIATRSIVTHNVRGCPANRTDDCANTSLWHTTRLKDIYYADVENLIVIIYHSFKTANKAVKGSSVNFDGYYESCDTKDGAHCKLVELEHVRLDRLKKFIDDGKQIKPSSLSQLEQDDVDGASKTDGLLGLSRFFGQRASRRKVRSLTSPSSFLQPQMLREQNVPGPRFDEQLGMDVWPLHDILKLAQVDLDEVRTMGDKSRHTRRDTGTQIVLSIRYTNCEIGDEYPGLTVFPFQNRVRDVEYTYSAQSVEDAVGYVSETVDLERNESTYLLRERRAINVIVQIDGQVLVWDSQTFVVFIGAVFGLFSIADALLRTYVLYAFSDDVKTKFKRDPEQSGRLVQCQ
eukprot:TRINITY_DN45473_c0_g1_i1.p1 TRINITY_DN45473_c0_g1~~TRINITY_DN45473_c0_g1_i1.p1  ORF type:complete len:478 (-),score=44.41 TRINITY_DN45473_c0_g1_i1:95-1366(-)